MCEKAKRELRGKREAIDCCWDLEEKTTKKGRDKRDPRSKSDSETSRRLAQPNHIFVEEHAGGAKRNCGPPKNHREGDSELKGKIQVGKGGSPPGGEGANRFLIPGRHGGGRRLGPPQKLLWWGHLGKENYLPSQRKETGGLIGICLDLRKHPQRGSLRNQEGKSELAGYPERAT